MNTILMGHFNSILFHKSCLLTSSIFISTFKYHVFSPMGRFQLQLIYLYFPPSSHLIYIDGTTVENKGKLILAFLSINQSFCRPTRTVISWSLFSVVNGKFTIVQLSSLFNHFLTWYIQHIGQNLVYMQLYEIM